MFAILLIFLLFTVVFGILVYLYLFYEQHKTNLEKNLDGTSKSHARETLFLILGGVVIVGFGVFALISSSYVPQAVAPSYNEITNTLTRTDLTSFQRYKYKASLVGSRIENWNGSILDIQRSAFGDTTITVFIFGASGTSRWDMPTAKIKTPWDKASSFSKGQSIVFSGMIREVSVSSFLVYDVTLIIETAIIELIK